MEKQNDYAEGFRLDGGFISEMEKGFGREYFMEFKKISSPTLRELFVQQLEDLILSGKLKIGEKLPTEWQLAESMQVSRSVVEGGQEFVLSGYFEESPNGVGGVFPRIIGKLYLGGLVESDGAVQAGDGLLGWLHVSGRQAVSAFDFRWLLISVALIGVAMAVATGVALQKMQKLSFRDAEGSELFSDKDAEGRVIFSDRDVEEVLARVKVEKIRGYIPALSDEGLANMEVLNGYRDAWIIIQVFDGEDMGQLLKYAEKSMGKEDLQEVIRMGNGAFILHKNMLNGEEEKAGKKIGSEFSVSELVVGVPTSPEERATLVNCGYLNVEDEAFPRLSLAWPDDATIWLAVDEDAFDMLGEHMTVQNFAIRFNVEEGQEPTAKEVLKNWVNQANITFLETGQPSMLELFSITCNSDAIAENETYIIGSRILMFVVSLFLVFAGIVNYTSMSMGNATSRRREFELLGNIGVTKKQIRGMLALESLIYFGVSTILILTVGNGLLFLLKDYMEGKLYYFTFHYPIEAWFGMFLLFGAISILLLQMLYRSKKSADVDVALTFEKN